MSNNVCHNCGAPKTISLRDDSMLHVRLDCSKCKPRDLNEVIKDFRESVAKHGSDAASVTIQATGYEVLRLCKVAEMFINGQQGVTKL